MRVAGRVRPPGDKSITQRGLLFAALAAGNSRIRAPLRSGDTASMVGVLRALGVPVSDTPDGFDIVGRGRLGFGAAADSLDCGNSGTTARLITGALAAHPFATRLVGDESLSRRPMRRVTGPLVQMGASFDEENGDGLPLTVRGGALHPLNGFQSPNASAQVKTALLLAGYSAGVAVEVSEPYPSRDHTERLFRHLGQSLDHAEGWLRFTPTGDLPGFDMSVPGDLSSAAFLIAAALLATNGELILKGVGTNPGRSGALRVLERMGAAIDFLDSGEVLGEPVADIRVRPSRLRATEVLAEEVPALIDEIPILAVLAARAEGTTVFEGVQELRYKESDRLALMEHNLREVGVAAEAAGDRLSVTGGTGALAGSVQTGSDHRIAMAFTVLGTLPGMEIELSETESAAISYPGFEDQLRSVLIDA